MLRILTFAYAVCGIFCIVSFARIIYELIKGKKITENFSSDWKVCIYIFVLLFAIYNEADYLNNTVPDGEYTLNVSVQFDESSAPYYLPAELHIYTHENYESGAYYAGGAEIEYTTVTRDRQFYLYKIDFEGNEIVIGQDVYPEKDIKVDIDEFGSREITINIGVISPQTLGIKPIDNWRNEGIYGKVETILVIASSAALIVQYFGIDKKRKEVMEEIRRNEWRKS